MLTLYGTEGCHLCHLAQDLLRTTNHAWQDVDIIDDDTLLARYETRIPVLRQGECELDWPFTLAELQAFLGMPDHPSS